MFSCCLFINYKCILSLDVLFFTILHAVATIETSIVLGDPQLLFLVSVSFVHSDLPLQIFVDFVCAEF